MILPAWGKPKVLGLLAGVTVLLFGIATFNPYPLSLPILGISRQSASLLPAGQRSSVLVGPRNFGPFYHGRGCTSSDLLIAVANAQIRADGPSRTIDPNAKWDEFDVNNLSISFNLDGCPSLHLFTPAETCDLLGAFGGLMLSGDSFVRHVTNALFILMTGQSDGALSGEKETCRGERTFFDQPPLCRTFTYKNSEEVPEKLCGGNVFINSDEVYSYRSEFEQSSVWEPLLSIVPPAKRSRSPVLLSSHGIHFGLDAPKTLSSYIYPFVAQWTPAEPRPVLLWAAIHAPPVNKPAQYLEEQGPVPTKKFNADIGRVIDELSPGPIIGPDGILKHVDWYNVTDGAQSLDGGHYSLQVNVEKALILLNILDAVWGEARDAGGLLRD